MALRSFGERQDCVAFRFRNSICPVRQRKGDPPKRGAIRTIIAPCALTVMVRVSSEMILSSAPCDNTHNRNLQHDALAAALNDVLASIRWRDADHEESVSSRTRPILVLQWFR